MQDDRAHDRDGDRGARRGEIPGRRWWDLVLRVKDSIAHDNAPLIAAGLAFFAFLAIPSALSALVALYGLVFDPANVGKQIGALAAFAPPQALTLVSGELTRITSSSNSNLSVALALSVTIALWSARSGTASLMSALNVTYGEREKRSIVKFELAAFAITVVAVAFTVLALALVAVVPAALALLPMGDFDKVAASVVRWPILVVLIMLAFSATYHFAPSRAEPRWRWVSPGAVVATALWIGGSALFSWYVSSFASYDKTYGSLGAVVVLLMWLYVSGLAVMIGGAFNAELEHAAAHDAAAGSPPPAGRRDAYAAQKPSAER